jgi:cystathionine beta-lyase
VIQRSLDHGVYGYGHEPKSFWAAWVAHVNTRYQWEIDADWIVPIAGVVPAMRLALMAHPEITEVITPSPAYPYFHSIPEHAGLRTHRVALTRTPQGLVPVTGALDAAFDALNAPSALLWCNPHNPGGALYDRSWLAAALERAREHQTLVISDEIWADLGLNGRPHTPAGQVAAPDQSTITLMAATKTFNLASFPCAVAIIPEPHTRRRLEHMLHAMPHVTPLAYQITEAVLREGWPWHACLLEALQSNRDRVHQWAAQHPELAITTGDASFLAWIEPRDAGQDQARHRGKDPNTLADRFVRGGVRLSDGRAFGDSTACRLNFGCHPTTLDTALDRMHQVLETHH